MTDSNEALLAAVEAQDTAAIAAALAAGADVNARDIIESSALHLAVMSRNLEVVRLLCERGADLTARNSDDSTAFGYSGGMEDPITQVLAEAWFVKFGPKARLTQLLYDVLNANDEAALAKLVAEGVDLDASGWHQETPVIFATQHCSLRFLRALLDAGANPNATDGHGNTALHAACRGTKDAQKKAQLLIERGADVNAQGFLELRPLHFAAESAYLDVITLLIDRGADPNAETDIGKTPLSCAGKKQKVLELLKARGAR